MTILAAYAPESYAINDDRAYPFTFPAADNAAVEVYEIITVEGVDYRYLVPVQDYTITWISTAPRYPLKENGTVTFSRAHSVGAATVSIERNTLIDQTFDLPDKRGPFNGRMIEFAFDKATMICQELAARKCNVVTSTPMTQEVVYGSYHDFQAAVINFSVNKIFDILAEIDASADDCTETPEDA